MARGVMLWTCAAMTWLQINWPKVLSTAAITGSNCSGFTCFSYRARLYLVQGRWAQAAETADMVLRIPRTSISPRITALTVLGLVRARRGDPGHRPLLDEAWDLAQPTGEFSRLGPVAAARAEAAWLGCDPDGVASATEPALALALRCSLGPSR